MKISAHRALPLSALLLASLLLISGCDKATPFTAADPAHTGKIEISDEVRRLLPKGTKLFYSKSIDVGPGVTGPWMVEKIDIDTGTISTVISSESADFIELLPQDVSPDGQTLLVRVREKGTDNLFLIQVNLKTLEYSYFSEGIYARYSPNGKKIVTYKVENPKEPYKPILKVYIQENNGEVINAVPCKGRKCFHPDWSGVGDSIYFIEDNDTFVIYNLLNLDRKIFKSQKYRLRLPQQCGNEIQMRALPISDPNSDISSIVLFGDNQIKVLSSANIYGFSCYSSDLSIVTMHEEGQQLYLGIFQQRAGVFHRLTPGPSRTTAYISPVLYVEHK